MSAVIIPTRTNLHLWLLTGRSNNFVNNTLNSGIGFNADVPPRDVVSVRKLLKLHDTISDFHVLAVLAATRALPSVLRELPDERATAFHPGMLKLPAVTSTLVMLPPTGHSWPSVDGRLAGKAGYTSVTFTGTSSTTAEITTDTGAKMSTPMRQGVIDGGYRVVFDKADKFGIRAHFKSPTSFGIGDVLTVSISPTVYPFAAVAEKLASSPAATRLMIEAGVMEAFSTARYSVEKVGAAGAAIMLAMSRRLALEQGGFSITVEKTGGTITPPVRTYTTEVAWTAELSPDKNCDVTENFNV